MDRSDGRLADVLPLLRVDEVVAHHLSMPEMMVTITDLRIILRNDHGVALDLPFSGIRRVELDIERARPSTLVLVPEQARHDPQMLSVLTESLDEVGAVVATIGRHLHDGAALPD